VKHFIKPTDKCPMFMFSVMCCETFYLLFTSFFKFNVGVFGLCIMTVCVPFDNLCAVMASHFAWYLTTMIVMSDFVSVYMPLIDHLL
jgi:hypothetical protein